MRRVTECPCCHCPYDCDYDECAEYLVWSAALEEKQHKKEIATLTRKYKTALKRIETLKNEKKELKKQLRRLG